MIYSTSMDHHAPLLFKNLENSSQPMGAMFVHCVHINYYSLKCADRSKLPHSSLPLS